MLDIVITMAGRGSRFALAGYEDPKPLIAVAGVVPMVRLVIDNLRPRRSEARFVFLCLEEQLNDGDLEHRLLTWAGSEALVIPVDGVTEGAASTVLLARDVLSDRPLMIANSDQFIDSDIDNYLDQLDGHDGLIMTMTADDPKWSFVRTDGESVTSVAEKVVVSNEATVGIYNFARGSDFLCAANEMISAEFRVNGEFYVAPVYNWMLAKGASVRYTNVGEVGRGMHGLGTPADLADFERSESCRIAIRPYGR